MDRVSVGLLKEQLLLTYDNLLKSTSDIKSISKQRLSEVQGKLDKLEERFAYGEIDREIFDKIGGKLQGRNPFVRA